MPKRVDHEQRREQITRVLWRVAMTDGLGAATLRRVAADAGMSMNLVQYYFPTKAEMVHFGLRRLFEWGGERLRSGWPATGTPREVLRACLVALLPVTEDGRVLSAVHLAYRSYAVVDPELREMVQGLPKELGALLTPLLQEVCAEPEWEIYALLAMTDGAATAILMGSFTEEEAVAVLDHQLAKLFTD
jgi:TetR/AcrR family transcriptional regulator, transcriptional repressor of bet genes